MSCLYDDRTDQEYRKAYEAWWAERGWIYDLVTGLVGLLFLLALLMIAGMFKG